MSEFVFRNLSVKVFPAEARAEGECVCCSYEVHCDACTHCTDSATKVPCSPCTDAATQDCGECTLGVTEPPNGPCKPCTGNITDDCFPCTDFDTTPCFGPFSHRPVPCDDASCQQDTGCLDTITVVIPARRPTAVLAQELALLRTELRAALGRPTEEPLGTVDEVQSLEEIDRLKGALLGAVAELDERRSQLDRGHQD